MRRPRPTTIALRPTGPSSFRRGLAKIRALARRFADGWNAFAPSIPGWRTLQLVKARYAWSEADRLRILRPAAVADKLDADAESTRCDKQLRGIDAAIRQFERDATRAEMAAMRSAR